MEVSTVRNSYKLFGEPVPSLRGKTTNERVRWNTHVDDVLVEPRKKQTMATDVMWLEGEEFLISVFSPLEITFNSYL